ncbi:uncharacterized protein LOC132278365 [Cornus florida]|uniref:uncharacterized protein LOC132278365 n=1 Tax=Cornus florida TaxID=4283 RepID=UPI0028995A16|nr:uncharacterized protein LOC132278365 [Cornus florida]
MPSKQSEIRKLISKKRLDIVSIIETKISPTNIAVVHSRIAAHWPLIHNYSFSQLGRIWVMWNPNTINLNVISTTRQSIHCYITIIGQNITFYTSFVYASNYAVERLSLWNDIISHSTLVCNNPWILMGDFNIISKSGEKNGGSTRECPAINDLCECLQQAELEDLRFSGILFTWNNRSLGNACIAKKLDRALINYHWNAILPSSECTFLPPRVSDHSPILTLPKSVYLSGSSMHGVLIPNFFPLSNAPGAIILQVVKWELDKCQLDLDHNPNDIHLRSLNLSLTKECMKLAGVQENKFRQKSRMVWLKLDSNLSYFHKFIVSRANKEKILNLSNADGVQINDTEAIKEEILSHFQILFSTAPPITYSQTKLSIFITKAVPIHFHNILDSIPSYYEIQNCMMLLNKDKTPGPDGYNAMFFHKTWPIVGRSTIKAISVFFRCRKLLSEANCTYISLVPKCQNPSYLNDYRPISCCNTIYKCIAKLLTKKLQLVLPHIIDQTQTAFVKGRKIINSVLLTYELLRGYHRDCPPPRYAIKIDLRKDFNSVTWDFTINCLSLLKFPSNFIKFIHACISSPSFTVAINDGLFLFCHGDITSVSILKSAMDYFCTMSGLSINFNKSTVFLSGVDPSTESAITDLL